MSFENFFNEGVQHFKAQEYSKAADLFQQALALQPDNPSVLTNLALSQYEQGKKIEAYVYFKKALHLDPSNQQAQQGLEFVKTQVQLRDIPHQIEFYEKARDYLITPVSGHLPYALSWGLFLLLGYRLIRYLNQKRQAYFSGEDFPPFGIGNAVISLFFILSLSWSLFYNYDQFIPRALVKDETLALRSAPSIGSPTILELYGGLEVRVLRHQDDWIQIQYPGSFSGWVQKESLVKF